MELMACAGLVGGTTEQSCLFPDHIWYYQWYEILPKLSPSHLSRATAIFVVDCCQFGLSWIFGPKMELMAYSGLVGGTKIKLGPNWHQSTTERAVAWLRCDGDSFGSISYHWYYHTSSGKIQLRSVVPPTKPVQNISYIFSPNIQLGPNWQQSTTKMAVARVMCDRDSFGSISYNWYYHIRSLCYYGTINSQIARNMVYEITNITQSKETLHLMKKVTFKIESEFAFYLQCNFFSFRVILKGNSDSVISNSNSVCCDSESVSGNTDLKQTHYTGVPR